jgi:hypothetical protein
VVKRLVVILILSALVPGLAGCGSSKNDDKQPKLSGPGDPRIKGPASPSGGKTAPAGAQQRTGVD